MTNDNGAKRIPLEEYALKQIQFHNGIKGQQLFLNVIAEYPELVPSDIMARLISLVADGAAIEIEYHTPGQMSRSFLIPRGARVEISK